MSYKVSLSVNHGLVLAIIMGIIAALTYVVDQNAPVTVSIVLMAIVTGITSALHYEQQTSTPVQNPQNQQ